MQITSRRLSAAVLVIIFTVFSGCTSLTDRTDDAPLPLDPQVEQGVLENGLKWFYMYNTEPENRASLRLVVNAGSVLEQDDQKGLAHFCEHMAFNGSANFNRNDLIEYLESIGMKFGPEINAFTGFDETVYMLEIPTDDKSVVENAFQVLEDWAHLVSYEDEEIEKERGVIREEWRLGRGLSGRVLDSLVPQLFRGSVYADRLPIGSMDVVMNAPPQRLRDFYQEWYRPDLMAVVVVGDIERDLAVDLVARHFSFEGSGEESPRPVFDVPPRTDDSVLIIRDPEVNYASVEINKGTGLLMRETKADFREMLTESLVWEMINNRLEEVVLGEDPPFINAGGGSGSLVRGYGLARLSAAADPASADRALHALLSEAERAVRYGFSGNELDRAVKNLLASITEYYNDRENIHSSSLASGITDFFLSGVYNPGAEAEYRLYNELLPEISTAEAAACAERMLSGGGRLVTLIVPETADIPDEAYYMGVLDGVNSMELELYSDVSGELDLTESLPEPGAILSETVQDEDGTVVWELSNGARVVIRETDFREDSILFSAASPGGLSLVSDEDFISGRYAPLLLSLSGLGKLDALSLQKAVAGSSINISPYIGGNEEGLGGSFSGEDTELFMQLLHLYFTEPVFSSGALENLKIRLGSAVGNRSADPLNVYYDRLTEIMTNDDFRSRPPTPESVGLISRDVAEKVYRSRFSGAGDFVFVFTGSASAEDLRPQVLRYIASLPSGSGPEQPADLGVRPPSGIIEEEVLRGLEPQSRVSIVFSGLLEEWDRDSVLVAEAACSVMETILRERLREDLGGTYNISVSPAFQRSPVPQYSIYISFGCDPDRAGELSDEIFRRIESASRSVDNSYILKQEEQYRRSMEENLLSNDFWISHLAQAFFYGDDPSDLVTADEYRNLLTPESVSGAVRKYMRTDSYVKLVLVPENVKVQ